MLYDAFQVIGIKRTITVVNSKRPSIIPMDKSHLAVSGREEKFPVGPMVFPNPGPVLAKADMAPVRLVIKSSPVKDKAKAKKTMLMKNIETKITTLLTISSVIGRPL